MANENTASYAKIGFVIFIGILAIVGTLIYLGGLRGKGDFIYAETYCDKSVSGLSVGSAVNFRGVKIGEVAKIGFVGDEYDVPFEYRQKIYILLAFPRRYQADLDERGGDEEILRRLVEKGGARATVTASGITGLSRIEIDLQPGVPPPQIAWTPRTFYLPCSLSLLDSFSDSATKVMNQINKMDLTALWSNVNATVLALEKTSEGAQSMLETRRADVEKILGDLSETTSAIRDLTNELRDNPSLLIRERTPDPLKETK